jgi:hypothetical protein
VDPVRTKYDAVKGSDFLEQKYDASGKGTPVRIIPDNASAATRSLGKCTNSTPDPSGTHSFRTIDVLGTTHKRIRRKTLHTEEMEILFGPRTSEQFNKLPPKFDRLSLIERTTSHWMLSAGLIQFTPS